MKTRGYIRDVKVDFSDHNYCHETMDDLMCDICRKKQKSVIANKLPNGDIKILCFDCHHKTYPALFWQHDEDFIYTCMIEDIGFKDKVSTKKRVRNEMTLKLRYQVMKRDNFQCVLCGRRPPEVELFVDHIKPVARGGDNSPNNLRTLCFECNAGKGVDEE